MTNQRGNAQRPKGIRVPDQSVGRRGGTLTPTALRQATRFHGHLGPWLVLGLKAGTYARSKLAASPFELRARVFCPQSTPYTCFVDGIQFSSGCTMGKGNISHQRADECRVEFTRTGDANEVHHKDTVPCTSEVRCQKLDARSQKCGPGRIRLTLRPEVWDELHSRPCKGMTGAARLGREFASRRLAELFIT
jgi:formylmethanofuran dehydrogenase subunit E